MSEITFPAIQLKMNISDRKSKNITNIISCIMHILYNYFNL